MYVFLFLPCPITAVMAKHQKQEMEMTDLHAAAGQIFFYSLSVQTVWVCKTGNGISFALALLLVIRLKAINYDYAFVMHVPCSSSQELNSLFRGRTIRTNIHDETLSLKQHFQTISARVTDKFKPKGRFTDSTKVLSCIFKQHSNNTQFNSKCFEESFFLRCLSYKTRQTSSQLPR